MSEIIVSNINNITLSSGLIKIVSSKGELLIDIKQMMKEPVDSENAYFNATRVASFFSRGKELNKFMNLSSTKEYIKMLDDEFFDYTKKGVIKNRLKTHFVKRGRETEENKGTFGTYLHNELFFEYLGWCDVKFRREIHKIMKQIISQSREIKIEREQTKILYKDLTRVIDKIYIPEQKSDNGKKFAYSNLAGLVNIKVLGSLASKYVKDNKIEIETGKTLRDYLDKEILEKIKDTERIVAGIIEFGKIYEYEEIKLELEKRF